MILMLFLVSQSQLYSISGFLVILIEQLNMQCITNLFVSVVSGHKISRTSTSISFDTISKLKDEYCCFRSDIYDCNKSYIFFKDYHHVTFLCHH